MKNFLVLVQVPANYMNGTVGAAEKKFSINFSKERTKFCLCLLIMVTVVIYSFTKKIYNF